MLQVQRRSAGFQIDDDAYLLDLLINGWNVKLFMKLLFSQ